MRIRISRCPRGPLAAGWREDAEIVLRRVDIASFQLAAVRLGIVDEIVWLRPRWAETFPDGPRSFRIGSLANGELAVDDPSDHYVLDAGYADPSLLADTQPVRFRVLPLDEAAAGALLAESPVVLDIDEDTFGDVEPVGGAAAALGYTDADLDRLRAIFAPSGLGLSVDPATRVRRGAGAARRGRRARARQDVGAADRARRILGARHRARSISSRSTACSTGGRGPERGRHLLRDGREVVGLPEHRADPAEIAQDGGADRRAAAARQRAARARHDRALGRRRLHAARGVAADRVVAAQRARSRAAARRADPLRRGPGSGAASERRNAAATTMKSATTSSPFAGRRVDRRRSGGRQFDAQRALREGRLARDDAAGRVDHRRDAGVRAAHHRAALLDGAQDRVVEVHLRVADRPEPGVVREIHEQRGARRAEALHEVSSR
jgi:hypothetical protein